MLTTFRSPQTVVGYSVLPLSMSTQVLRSDGSLPVVKELLPMYLNVSPHSCLSVPQILSVRGMTCTSTGLYGFR